MTFMINFDGADSYTGPFEAQGSDLLPFSGYTFGKVTKVVEGVSKESKNQTLKFEIVIEEPTDKQGRSGAGMKVNKVQPVSGIRTDKKPNVLGLLDILTSVYSDTEASTEAAIARAKALNGNQVSSEGVMADTLGKRVYIDVEPRKFTRADGTEGWSTDIRNFIPRKRYEDALAAGFQHRDLPEDATREPKMAGATGTTNVSAVSPATNSATSSARKLL